jgi:hypothetical protein
LKRTEGRRNGDIGRVASSRNHDATDPRVIVPRVKGKPATLKKHLVQCAEIHGCRVGRDADVAEVACTVPFLAACFFVLDLFSWAMDARKEQEIIRLWNRLRLLEKEGRETTAVRHQIEKALAERDRRAA